MTTLYKLYVKLLVWSLDSIHWLMWRLGLGSDESKKQEENILLEDIRSARPEAVDAAFRKGRR